MQHIKITEKLGEFQKFIDSDNKTGLCLEDTIKFFDIQRIFGQFESVKQSGVRVTLIMATLLIIQHLKFSLAILFFMVIAIRGIEAANCVKVATIGSHPGIVDKSQGMQHVVDQVIEFWRDELPLVLPDKPDLIVLTEACDRPKGLTREEQFEYYRVRKNQVLDFLHRLQRKTNAT